MEIYLDHAATTKPLPEAVTAAVYAMETAYGNPSSLHRKGLAAEQLLTIAREQLARALSCEKGEVIFTSGATESNNMAVLGTAAAKVRQGKRIVTTAIEHPSVLEPLAALEQQGYEIIRLLPDAAGQYQAQQFADAVDERTVLVSAMQVNNETGLILPVEEIAREIKRKNPAVLFHVDGVQGFLKYAIKLKNASIDLLSLSGHKIGAPKGAGALYVKKGVRILPITYGGGQENKRRPGTESVPAIAGFGAAVVATQDTVKQDIERYFHLNRCLRDRLSRLPEVSIFSGDYAAPYITAFSVQGIRSEVMLHFLEQYYIYLSSGSACSKGAQSHVLQALGISRQQADTVLRVSFGPDTTEEMLGIFADKLVLGMKELQKIRR